MNLENCRMIAHCKNRFGSACFGIAVAAMLVAALARPALAVDFGKSTGNQWYYDTQGNGMPYRLFLPDGYNTPGTELPLVLFLHATVLFDHTNLYFRSPAIWG